MLQVLQVELERALKRLGLFLILHDPEHALIHHASVLKHLDQLVLEVDLSLLSKLLAHFQKLIRIRDI